MVKMKRDITSQSYKLGFITELNQMTNGKLTKTMMEEKTWNRGREKSWRFDCLQQTEYWTDTHFWIFAHGWKTEQQRKHQILRFCCHNMRDEQINSLLECMAQFQCSLHIREEKNLGNTGEE